MKDKFIEDKMKEIGSTLKAWVKDETNYKDAHESIKAALTEAIELGIKTSNSGKLMYERGKEERDGEIREALKRLGEKSSGTFPVGFWAELMELFPQPKDKKERVDGR